MPLRCCDFDACDRAAVRRDGDCLLCAQHLCRTHLQRPWHKCPQPEEDWDAFAHRYGVAETRDIDALLQRLDASKLCARASMLRGGVPCTVDLSRKHVSAMMGGQNCHAEIVFQDGLRWIARFRLARPPTPPLEIRDYVLQSEAATMMYLGRHTNVPVPRVFDWACESDAGNQLGVGYILMEKVDGTSLDWWAATPAQREHLMRQMVDISLDIAGHPFDSMGSLMASLRDPAQFEVRGFAQPDMFQPETKSPLGPFSSPTDAFHAMAESYLALIAAGEVVACRPADAYLAHRFRLDVLDVLCTDKASESRFFLKHPDDKGDHILVNKDFDIVGIIDWEWTRTASAAEAFCSPLMMLPLDKFYNGSNELTQEELQLARMFQEKGRQDLSDHVMNSRKVQRFFFALGPDCPSDMPTFVDLFNGLRGAYSDTESTWEQWKASAISRWRDDNRLQTVMHEQKLEEKA